MGALFMKNFTMIAFVLVICVSVWGIVIWNIAQDNETANDRLPVEELEEVELVEVDPVPSQSERYHEKGITREDGRIIAPEGVIPVDELLQIVKEQ